MTDGAYGDSRFDGSSSATSDFRDPEDYDDIDELDEAESDLILPMRENWQLDQIPEPELTPQESQLPPANRLRRVISKKCNTVKCYNFYSVEYLASLLTAPDRSVTGRYGEAVATQIIGPERFYLNWISDLDKIFLLTTWITAEIMDEDFIEPIKGTTDLVGTTVAALFSSVGCFHRARVLKVGTGGDIATVFFIDHGLTTNVDVDKMRVLPEQLVPIPDFAIRCKLARVNFTKENLGDVDTRKELIWELGSPSATLQCKVTQYYEDSDTCTVKVKIFEGLTAPRLLNRVIREKYNARQAVNKVLHDPKTKQAEAEAELLHRNADVEIGYFSTLKLKGLRAFRITEAKSPKDFSVEYLVDYSIPPGGTVWQSDLQNFYNGNTSPFYNKLATCRPLISRCYVVQTTNYGWQRCRLISRHDEFNTCDVLLLDLAMEIRIPFAALHEIHPQFSQVCALGFKAYLVDIIPCDGGQVWPTQVCNVFQKMVIGKTFHAVIIERQEAGPNSKFQQIDSKLGLIMIEKKHPDAQGSTKMALNAQLCAMDLAQPSGIAGAIPFTDSTEDRVFEYQAMKNALLQENLGLEVQQFRYDPKEDQVTTSNVKSITRLKNIANTLLDTYDPTLSQYNYFNVVPEKLPKNMMGIPRQIRECMATCVISYIASPSCLYVQLVEKVSKLKQMMKYIEQQLTTQPEIPSEQVVVGMEVAVFLFDEREAPSWFRGVVRAPIPNIKLAKVILVDYGNEVSVKYSAMRQLPDYYSKIPGFAQRVHLDIPNLIPTGGMPTNPNWSTLAVDTFRKYMSLWQPENPLYYFWRSPRASTVELDLYAQELQYDSINDIWTKRPHSVVPMMEADLLPTNTAKQSGIMMTRNLRLSLGIDLVFETLTDENSGYKFERVADVLVKKGLAIFRK